MLEAGLGPRDTNIPSTGLVHQGACGAAGYASAQKSNRPVGENVQVKGKKPCRKEVPSSCSVNMEEER